MTRPLGPRPAWLTLAFPATVILIPYLSVALPFRRALAVQAALLLGATLALLAIAWLRGGWTQLRELRRASPGIFWGLVLYASAALLGSCVALWRGNSLDLIAGQALSMGLLPLAAVAMWSLGPAARWPGLAIGSAAAVVVGSILQLGYWLNEAFAGGRLALRLFLANSISVSSAALLALLLLGALPRRLAALRYSATFVMLLLILGTGTRGLWLATVLGVASFAFLARGSGLRWRLIPVLVSALLLLLGASSLLAWARTVEAGGRKILASGRPGELLEDLGETAQKRAAQVAARDTAQGLAFQVGPAVPNFLLGGPLAVEPQMSYKVLARFRYTAELSSARPFLVVLWMDPLHRQLGALTAHSLDCADDSCVCQAAGVAPEGTSFARLMVAWSSDRDEEWTLDRLEVWEIAGERSAIWINAALQLEHLASRGLELSAGQGGDPSLGRRLAESRYLLEEIGKASLPTKLLGRGLGATYDLETFAPDDQGRWTVRSHPNYIHNFYLFLLFKLGGLGAGMVVLALGLWLREIAVAARGIRDPGRAPFCAALAAALLAYSIWSLTSPEILDFRIAPLWGAALALGARAAQQD